MKSLLQNSSLACLAVLAAWSGDSAVADENIMGYVYGAETLPKGKWEAYQWITSRIGKESGRYVGLDFRTEAEYGFTDRLQGSLYLNTRYNNLQNAVGSSEVFEDRDQFGFDGVSTEFKYMLMSPYKDAFGLALYLEPGYSRIEKISGEPVTEFELEGKVILQKNFLDDTLISQANFTIENEWEKERHAGEYETAGLLEFTGGLSYRFARNWFAGLETRVHTELPEWREFEHVAVFVGPSIHYGARRWWATLAVLPQVWGWPDKDGKGGLHFDEHERVEVRLKVGYNF